MKYFQIENIYKIVEFHDSDKNFKSFRNILFAPLNIWTELHCNNGLIPRVIVFLTCAC